MIWSVSKKRVITLRKTREKYKKLNDSPTGCCSGREKKINIQHGTIDRIVDHDVFHKKINL